MGLGILFYIVTPSIQIQIMNAIQIYCLNPNTAFSPLYHEFMHKSGVFLLIWFPHQYLAFLSSIPVAGKNLESVFNLIWIQNTSYLHHFLIMNNSIIEYDFFH